jgi:hypothetical protein
MSNIIGAVANQPTNINFLSTHRFRVMIKRIPNVVYFCQEANLPGVSMGNPHQPTPFVDIPRPGDKVQFEDFSMTFPVDEDMRNYKEIFNWIIGLGFPKDYNQFRRLSQSPEGIYSDIGLLVLNSDLNVQHEISFHGAFPTALSGISFNVKESDTNIPLATATFKYQSWSFHVAGASANEA